MLEKFSREFPGVVRIEPSSLCNLKCIHCPTGTTKANRGLMDSKTFDLVIKNITEHHTEIRVVVLYHGGEPLLNKKFPLMVKRIKDIGIPFIKTVSNGMLLTDEIIEKICQSGLDEIVFSLDGTSFRQNDFIRRGCIGEEVVRNIKKLVAYKKTKSLTNPNIFIASTQFVKGTQNTNTEQFSVSSINKTRKIKQVYLDSSNLQNVPKYLLDAFSDEIKQQDLTFRISVAMKWPDMNVDEKQFSVLCNEGGTQISNYCDHILNTITVRWNGDVVPCCYDLTSRIILGNINDDNLETIWNNEQYLRLRLGVSEEKFHPLCDECNTVKIHKYLCIREDFTRI